MKVTKRNKQLEEFQPSKIAAAIDKAFRSVGRTADSSSIDGIVKNIDVYDGIGVEEIQDQIEDCLMDGKYFDVAKSFILYRQQQTEDRETLSKVKFLSDYCEASNAATGSKYDANANVEHKNIATLIGELPKSNFIRLNRRLLTDRIEKMYGKELAEKYIDMLTHHFIYKNDETCLANYCASITMYPWLLDGTIAIGGNSTAPTNLKSFCGGFVNMVFMVSSMLSGACATPEFLMYLNYFIGLEYGKDYYKEADKVVDLSLKQRTIDKIITDCFEQIVYSINQPTGARNYQAVFWNIAYYDKPYFESLFGEFCFPDGSKPDWEGLSWLQKRFMKWFNKERTKTVLTFPVETMALLSKDGDMVDQEYADFTAEMYSEGHSFFTYMSDNADSLSSCCFSGDTKILWRYSDMDVDVHYTSLKELYDKNLNKVLVWHNDGWEEARPISLPNRKMLKVSMDNGDSFVMTDNHINYTADGEKRTDELNVGDLLRYNSSELKCVGNNSEDELSGERDGISFSTYRFVSNDTLEYLLDSLTKSTEYRMGLVNGFMCRYDNDGIYCCETENSEVAECLATVMVSLGLNVEGVTKVKDEEDGVVWSVVASTPEEDKEVYHKITAIKGMKYDGNVYCLEMKNVDEPYFTLPCGLITHNCRLRNEIQDNGFSYTLGAGGVSTGSKSVLTININRCVQYAVNNGIDYVEFLTDIVDLCHKTQLAYNENLKELQKHGMLPLFDAGYINIARQYLTIGVNGLVEAAEFLGLRINDNDDYRTFVQTVLGIVEKKNKEYRTDEVMFNCEMIPAENVGVKHAKWDKEDGYKVPRDCYNSYFYVVEDESLNVIDKFKLHGRPYIEHLTGGSANHVNLEEHLSKAQYRQILNIAAKEGCNYFTFNIPNTICNECGNIDKRYLKECPRCHSKNVDYLTRIIGYLKRVSNFSQARQEEAGRRYYASVKNL